VRAEIPLPAPLAGYLARLVREKREADARFEAAFCALVLDKGIAHASFAGLREDGALLVDIPDAGAADG